MKELIDSFGVNNFIIIVAVVIAILLALLIIFIIEKINKRNNKDYFDYYETDDIDDEIIEEYKENLEENITNQVIENDPPIDEQLINLIEEVPSNIIDTPEKEEIPVKVIDTSVREEVIYKQDTLTEQEAKKTLQEVTKKLMETDKDNDIIDHTHFEVEQEERSIISYEELKKINYNIDEVNDNLLLDEGNEPITIDELYYTQNSPKNDKYPKEEIEDLKNVIEQTTRIDLPVINNNTQVKTEDINSKKFKNSEVISPVFGIYKNVERKNNARPIQSIEDTVEIKQLELEIQKTEEFLKELKKLKDKLD